MWMFPGWSFAKVGDEESVSQCTLLGVGSKKAGAWRAVWQMKDKWTRECRRATGEGDTDGETRIPGFFGKPLLLPTPITSRSSVFYIIFPSGVLGRVKPPYSPQLKGRWTVPCCVSLSRAWQVDMLEFCPNLYSAEGGPELSRLFVSKKLWAEFLCCNKMLNYFFLQTEG